MQDFFRTGEEDSVVVFSVGVSARIPSRRSLCRPVGADFERRLSEVVGEQGPRLFLMKIPGARPACGRRTCVAIPLVPALPWRRQGSRWATVTGLAGMA